MDDDRLVAALRRMWRDRDPVPTGLADDVLVALGTRGLADEYALLTLVEESTQLAGTRGDVGMRILEFRIEDRAVMVRISDTDGGRVRLDGWVSPARSGSARLEWHGGDAETRIEDEGRFAFPALRRGAATLRLELTDDGVLETEQFEL